jgi:phage-related protein
LLGFFDGDDLIILTNGFVKKSQKTPQNEIKLAEKRKKDYLDRKDA